MSAILMSAIRHRAVALLREDGYTLADIIKFIDEPVESTTLRDEFAGRAMAQLIPQCNVNEPAKRDQVADLAYLIADAMMKRRTT